jgi:hypothetical protein
MMRPRREAGVASSGSTGFISAGNPPNPNPEHQEQPAGLERSLEDHPASEDRRTTSAAEPG